MQSDMLDATFRDVPFHVQSITDRSDRAMAVHEYPGRTLVEVEDLGWKARTIPVQAVFWGEDCRRRMEEFRHILELPGAGELIHPAFGSRRVVIRDVQIEQNAEAADRVSMSFNAVEAGEQQAVFEASTPAAEAEAKQQTLLQKTAQALRDAAKQARDTLDGVKRKVREVRESLMEIKTALEQELADFIDVYRAGREVAEAVSDWIEEAQSFIDDVEKTVRDVQAQVETTVSDYRRFVKTAQEFSRTALRLGGKSKNYGTEAGAAAWATGDTAGRAEAVPAVPAPAPAVAAEDIPAPGSEATVRGVLVAYIQIRQTVVLSAQLQDILMAQLDKPSLTPQEVESMVGNVRERLQDCMDYVRASFPAEQAYSLCENLREAAEAVQSLGRCALRARPALAAVTVDRECNFHLLAHKLYGDSGRAAELARINPQIKNPNFIAAGQELLAYAQ